MAKTTTVSLGDLLVALYDEFADEYGDDELARVATMATLNDLMIDQRDRERATVKRRGQAKRIGDRKRQYARELAA